MDHHPSIAASGLSWYAALTSEWLDQPVAKQKRAVVSPGFQEGLTLLEVESPGTTEQVKARIKELEVSGLAPSPLLTGDDLIREGIQAGPEMGQLLDRIYDSQLECVISTHEEAIQLLRSLQGH